MGVIVYRLDLVKTPTRTFKTTHKFAIYSQWEGGSGKGGLVLSHSAPSEIKNFLYSRQKAEEREKDRQLLTAHGAYILSTLLINCLRGGGN